MQVVHLINNRICYSQQHPAGDVTRVSVVPRKVTVKIGDTRISDGDAEIKID